MIEFIIGVAVGAVGFWAFKKFVAGVIIAK